MNGVCTGETRRPTVYREQVFMPVVYSICNYCRDGLLRGPEIFLYWGILMHEN